MVLWPRTCANLSPDLNVSTAVVLATMGPNLLNCGSTAAAHAASFLGRPAVQEIGERGGEYIQRWKTLGSG